MDRLPVPVRRALRTELLALATAACWAVWLGWDTRYDVDPVTGDASGPYQPWQVVGSVLCLIVVTAAAGRWLALPTVVTVVPLTFTAAFTVSGTVTSDGDALVVVGAAMTLVATTVGAALVASLAWLVRDVRAPRTGREPPRPTASARPRGARRR